MGSYLPATVHVWVIPSIVPQITCLNCLAPPTVCLCKPMLCSTNGAMHTKGLPTAYPGLDSAAKYICWCTH